MAGIGIAIGVDAQEVKAAKREVDALNRELRSTEEFKSVKLGEDGLPETQRTLKHLGDELRRLKGIAREGEKRGGILDTGQFKEAGKLSKEILGNFEKYHQQIKGANREFWHLVDAQARLQDLSTDPKTSAKARARYLSQIEGLTPEIEAARQRRDALLKYRGKYGAIASEAVDVSGDLGRFQSPLPGAGMLGMLGHLTMGKLAGLGAAVAGFKMYRFMESSIPEGEKYAALTAMAGRRGVPAAHEATLGYSPSQTVQIADTLSRSTALVGGELSHLTENVKKFSRAVGISDTTTSAYVGGAFGLTGMNPQGSKRQLDRIYNLLDRIGHKGRVEEFMQANLSVMERVASSVGGALSPEQQTAILGLQGAMFALPGQIGKGMSGANIIAQMNDAVAGGGKTRGQQLAIFHALGGGSVRDLSGLIQFQERMESGPFGKGPKGYATNLDAIIGFANQTWGQGTPQARVNLRAMLGDLKWTQFKVVEDALAKGGSLDGPGFAAGVADYERERGAKVLQSQAEKAREQEAIGLGLANVKADLTRAQMRGSELIREGHVVEGAAAILQGYADVLAPADSRAWMPSGEQDASRRVMGVYGTDQPGGAVDVGTKLDAIQRVLEDIRDRRSMPVYGPEGFGTVPNADN